MSTKIYDGFMFVPKDISTINKKIQEFRHKVDKYVSTAYKQHIADISSYFFDRVCCGLEKNEKNDFPFFHAISFLQGETRQIKRSMERNMFDLGCSTTIHLYKKRFYGMLFCDNKNINHMWFSQDWIKEYGYWDNTDPLEGISDKEWKQRGKNWDGILKEFNYTPSMNGFVAEFTKEMFYYIPFKVEDIIPLIPDYAERVRKIAYNYLFEDFCKMKKAGEIMQEFFAFDKWIKNGNPGFEKLIKTKNEFAKQIKKEITKEMLIGKINEKQD
jgi:hypothetical protein